MVMALCCVKRTLKILFDNDDNGDETEMITEEEKESESENGLHYNIRIGFNYPDGRSLHDE